jgi:hypothetical protein
MDPLWHTVRVHLTPSTCELASWAPLAGNGSAHSCMQRVGVAVMRLTALAKLNDQRIFLDWPVLDCGVRFSKEEHQLVDDTCKPGTPCVVFFPPLRSGDTIHTKAAVLPCDYSLN